MNKQLLLYLDNCVYSHFLDPKLRELKHGFLNCGHRLAFSPVHLTEMAQNQHKYAELLAEIDALFVSDPGAINGRYNNVAALESANPHQRFEENRAILPSTRAIEEMLAPFHHLLGGLNDKSFEEVVRSTTRKLESYVAQELQNSEVSPPNQFHNELQRKLNDGMNSLLRADFEKTRTAVKSQVEAARIGDPMRNMDPISRVDFLFSTLQREQETAIKDVFPINFARKNPIEKGDITSFAFMLFSIGLTKRKAIFSGPHQQKKFAAQFRDAMHIEEASRCDFFITFDAGAADLAAATFAYAGIPTGVAHLKLTPNSESEC